MAMKAHRRNINANEAALKMLSRRDYSAGQLLDRLTAKGHSPGEAADAVKALVRVGLVDDNRFARNHVELRLAHRPCGRALILAELVACGIEETSARQVLDELYPEHDESVYAERALKARFGEKAAAGYKAAIFLAGRGFREEICRRCLEQAVPLDTNS